MTHIRPLKSFRLCFACGKSVQLKASSADAAAQLGAAVTGRQTEEIAEIREMAPAQEGSAT